MPIRRKLRLVALGMMGHSPWGGPTWACLNWLRGFHRLGHEVWYVEDDMTWPYDPEQRTLTDDCAYAVRHIRHCLGQVGLPERWAFWLPSARKPVGGCRRPHSTSSIDPATRSSTSSGRRHFVRSTWRHRSA